jgi:catechol 2,3-dioxygenase-like lactoylglutathione lyase family enzyme
MPQLDARLIGVELYFDDLPAAERFYREKLGLELSRAEAGRYAQFGSNAPFLCLERKGTESYPSRDKAVVFLEVRSLKTAVQALGGESMVHVAADLRSTRRPWAVLHDPEGHNVVLVEKESGKR